MCGLDYSFADTADGPAFFAMMGMGVPVTAFGIWIELAYDPPLWVHMITTLPFLLVACILPLRFLKGALAAAQYVNRAEEGRLAKPPEDPGHSYTHSDMQPISSSLQADPLQDRYSLRRLRIRRVSRGGLPFQLLVSESLCSVAISGWKSPRCARYGRVLNRSGFG